MTLYDWFTFIKADLEYTWRFHRSSMIVFLYGAAFGLIVMFTGIYAWKNNVIIPLKDLQMVSIVAVGSAFVSIQWHLSNIIHREEEKNAQP